MPSFPPLVLLSVVLLPLLCNASPINRQVGISDNVYMTTQNGTDGMNQRVCSIDAVTYRDGETIPTSSPCEHCVCRPPGFACTITSCEYRPGCKAFRRSDQCCPEYQCECEKDGKIYQNGEKIMDTNNPCEVCYCQGGEIICAVIDCYWRNDCPPRYIDNRCCPMYDHCPPPAAQGPIRHRLPTLSSPVPISWHNLTTPTTTTTANTPPPPPSLSTSLATEASTTSTTTSTEASSSALPLSDEVSSSGDASITSTEPAPLVVQSDNAIDDIPVQINDDAVLPISPTTVQPELEGSLAEEAIIIPLNDDLHEENLVVASTQHLQDAVKPTQHLTLESMVVVEPTVALQAADLLSSSSANGTTVVAQPTKAVYASTDRPSDDQILDDDAADNTVITTSEPDNVILQDDLPSQTTSSSTSQQQPEQQLDATEQSQPEIVQADSVSPTETPTESAIPPLTHHDDVQQSTENTIQNDEVIVADVVATTEVVQAANTENPVAGSPEILVRHDLFEVNTQQPSNAEVRNDEYASATTPAAILDDNFINEEESVFGDDANSVGSTQAPASVNHDEVESQDAFIAATAQPENNLPAQDVIDDLLSVTTVSSLANDQPAEESATTQQSDSLLPSSISHDDETAEEVNNAPVATEKAIPLQDDAAPVTETINFINDGVTEPALTVVRDESSSPAVTANPVQQNDGESDVVTEGIVRDYHDDDAATERISNDDAEVVTETLPVSQDTNIAADPVQATERIQHQQVLSDAAPTERIIQADDVAQVTEAVKYKEDDNAVDDVILADEPSVTQQISHDDVVTERVAADQLNTDRIIEKANEISQDIPVPTEVPTVPEVPVLKSNDDHAFDIILDDEVIPSQPETLNQIREQAIKKEFVSSLLEEQRNKDLAVASTPIETTALPLELVVRGEVQNDEPVNDDLPVSATTQSNSFVEFLNDQVASESSTVYNDAAVELTIPSVRKNDEETTQRQFRDDIEELLQLRHHINGMPHEDEESASTTVVPPQQARGGDEIIAPTTIASNNVILDDETVAASTIQPESDHQVYRNKVQKVAEALQQFNVIPGSEESGSASKFRLEPEIFGGGSVEVQDEVSTAPSQVLRDDGESQPQTTVKNVLLSEIVPSNDQVVEVSTDKIVADDDLPVSNGITESIVLADATTPSTLSELINDEAEGSGSHDDVEGSGSHDDVEGSGSHDDVEGSGSHDDVEGSGSHDKIEGSGSHHHHHHDDSGAPIQYDTTEGSGLGRLDLETTVFPMNDDSTVVTSSPSSYSFRMDILSSVEDAVEGGSGHGETQQDAVAESTSPPPSLQDPIQLDAAPVSEQILINDDAIVPTANPEADSVQNDESAIVTTESLSSRFRTGLEEETESPVSASAAPVELQQNDFVQVSTGAPSGFAVEFRENDEVASETQAPLVVVPHDEPAVINQAPDIIPEDDEAVTKAFIPVLNLISSNRVSQLLAQDEAVTQVVVNNNSGSREEQVDNEAVTMSAPQQIVIAHDDAVTEANVPQPAQELVNDQVAVTQNAEVTSNDEPVTQSATQDESIAVTEAEERVANDEANLLATDTPNHDALISHNTEALALVSHDTSVESATSHVLVNDEVVTEALPVVASDDPVIFSDEPAPTVQPIDRLRADSIEQQTEQAALNDDVTAIANDDVVVTTTIPTAVITNNTSTPPLKVVKKEHVLPENGLPRIQPISPEIGRNNPHELRFDFPLPPEKEHSWLSRAVNQFRRMAGFSSDGDASTTAPRRAHVRVRVPSRRFLLF